MPISSLDPRTALVVVDLQLGTLAQALAHPAAEVVARAAELATAFRAQGLLVVLLRVDGTPAGRTEYGEGRVFPDEWTTLTPELAGGAGDAVLLRRAWSGFAGTSLQEVLTEGGATQVVVAGVATSFGVQSTARDAYDRGYNVVVAVDAVTDRSLEAHVASVTGVFPALGQVGTTAEILALLP
jgi:nicotinamidase-related amidase